MIEAEQKTGFLGLALVFLGLVGIAIAAGIAGAGCGPSGEADRDAKPEWFQEPTGPLVVLDETEISSQPLSGDASNFGSSSFSTNYRCGDNLCSCRDKNPRKSHDCADMIVNGCAGLPHCVPTGPDGKGQWCVCRAFPPGGGAGCPSCPIASVDFDTVPNFGFYTFTGGGAIYRQNEWWDSACQVMGTQWNGLSASVRATLETVSPSSERGKILAKGIVPGRLCTNAEVKPVEAALQAPPNGLYRTSDGAIRLLGQQPDEGPALRACQLSWDQFHTLMPNQADGSDPRYTDITGLTATNFVHWYTGNVAPCKDMEVATAQ